VITEFTDWLLFCISSPAIVWPGSLIMLGLFATLVLRLLLVVASWDMVFKPAL
jgi:hypothetical protein